ncbi:MAG: hypothetical protein IKI99_06005 [Firmicutes bacterium]|nr:hypothetical protein [Bacillota bacterium]
MNTYKLGMKFIVMMVFLAVVSVLAASVGISMVKDAGPDGENRILGIAFLVVGVSYVWSTLMMLAQLLMYKGTGLQMSAEGIANSFVCVNLFAFMFVAPVGFIPWDAVGKISEERGFYHASVDTSKVEAGFMGKLLLKLAGFTFGSGMIKPAVKLEDIHRYARS